MLFGLFGHFQADLLFVKFLLDLVHHQIDYGQYLGLVELMEHHGGVDPVEELGTEEAFDFVHDFFLHPVVAGSRRLSIVALNGEAQGRFSFNQVRPQVAGHNQDRISEVDPPPTGIGQLSSVEYL